MAKSPNKTKDSRIYFLYAQNRMLRKKLETTRVTSTHVQHLLESVNNRFGDFLSEMKSTSTTIRDFHDRVDGEKRFTFHINEKIKELPKDSK